MLHFQRAPQDASDALQTFILNILFLNMSILAENL